MEFGNEGIYVDLKQNGTMTVSVVLGDKTIKPIETGVTNEILALMDFDFQLFRHIVSLEQELVSFNLDPETTCPIQYKTETDDGDSIRKAYKRLMKDLPKINVIMAALVHFAVEDRCSTYFDEELKDFQQDHQLVQCIHEPMRAQFDAYFILDRLCHNPECPFYSDIDMTYQITQIYDDKEQKMVYRFRSPADYYSFLIMQFVMLNPAIQRCEYCDKFFIPKTRKATKYCDRPQWNGRTCKQVAPKAKHKALAEKDSVIKAYDRTKPKVYRRYERTSYMEPSERYQFYQIFCEWNEKATAARNAYLRGELSAKDALKIIEETDGEC